MDKLDLYLAIILALFSYDVGRFFWMLGIKMGNNVADKWNEKEFSTLFVIQDLKIGLTHYWVGGNDRANTSNLVNWSTEVGDARTFESKKQADEYKQVHGVKGDVRFITIYID